MARDRAMDTLFKVVCCALAALGIAPVVHMIATVAIKGGETIAKVGLLRFLIDVPPAPGSNEAGGIGPALVGTAMLLAVSMAIGIPLSLVLAILAVEFSESAVSKAVRFLARTLVGVPTIAVSMLIYSLVVIPMGGASALAGGIALAIVLLPYATTYIEMCLEHVPKTYRDAGYSLGMKRITMVRKVVLGMAKKCIAVSVVISAARAIGETSPLLFTAGSAHYTYPSSLLDPVSSITLLIFEFGLSPFKPLIDTAWGAALILTLAYLLVLLGVKLGMKGVEM